MGALNSASTFVAMMAKLQKQWDTLAMERGLTGIGSKVIVNDDVLLYGSTPNHCATINLKKCKFFHDKCEFVGVDVVTEGNKLAESKYAAFRRLEQPNTFGDLQMLIRLFGFYSKH